MANNTINFTINLDGNAYTGIAQIDKALGNVLVSAKNTKSFFERIKSSAFDFNTITDAIGKVTQAFQTMVGTSLDFEQQQANLKTLLNGDAEATENLVSQIREYGKATVYDRGGLVEAQKTMMAFGLDAEFAFGKLKNIGDIALGDSQKMQSLALAFSQATSSGKLMGQDLMQMINAGFNPLEVISQKTGKSMAELKEEMSKGGISADMLAQSLEWATEEGGRFYQGAESAAQTTAGKIAKMKDTIDEIKVSIFEATGGATAYVAEIGNMLVPLAQLSPLFIGIGNSIKWCKTNWSSFTNKIRTGVLKVSLDLGIMKYSITSAGLSFKFMEKMGVSACRKIGIAIMNIPIIGWIAAIIAAVISVVTILWEKSEGFRRVVMGVWEAIKAIFNNIWVVIKAVVAVVWEGILKPVFDAVKNAILSVWEGIKSCIDWIVSAAQTVWDKIVSIAASIGEFFASIWNWIVEGVQKVIDWIVSAAQTVWDKIVSVATSIGEFFSNIWNWIVECVSGIINWISEKFSKIGSWLKEHIVEPIRKVFSKLWDIIKGIFDKIKNKLKDIIKPIINLWNKVFKKDQIKDVGEAYQGGAEKGSESFRKSHQEDEEDDEETVTEPKTTVLGTNAPGTPPTTPTGTSDNLSGGSLGKSAGTSAGKAQQINITLSNMVGTMNFNGGLHDNRHDVERQLTEIMARVLGMAETAI